MPLRIRQLAAEFLKSPKEILVETKTVTLENINQVVVKVSAEKKFARLCEILQTENPYLAMIFCAKKEGYDQKVIRGGV